MRLLPFPLLLTIAQPRDHEVDRLAATNGLSRLPKRRLCGAF